jgi:hypothetical protein
MVRALNYENNGFWLMTKRLSKEKFSGWPTANQCDGGKTFKTAIKRQ